MASSTTTQEVSSKEVLEAQSHLWNHIFSFINSLSLKCAIELGIPDAVYNHAKPITLTELTTALSIPHVRVQNFQRLMTLLVHNGYFTVSYINPDDSKEEVYGLTKYSAILVKDKGTVASIAPFVEMILAEPTMDAWQVLSSWFRSEQPSTAFEKYHGMYVWNAVGVMPEFGKLARDGLGDDSAAIAKVIVEEHGDIFRGVESVVEVAGGKGGLAVAIAKAFPHIKCKVLDLAPMIEIVEENGLVEYVAGDMFQSIPPADALILKWVIMTWSDEESVKILKRCKDAVPTKEKGGKVIIIDKVMDTSDGVHPNLTQTQLFYDIHMLVHLTGKLRIESEWKKLFDEAGFKEYKIISALGMRRIIELYH